MVIHRIPKAIAGYIISTQGYKQALSSSNIRRLQKSEYLIWEQREEK